MLDQLTDLLTENPVLSTLARILVFFVLAWIVHRLAWQIAGPLVRLSPLTPRTRRPRPERQSTLQGLMTSAIRFLVWALAVLATLAQFVSLDTLVWMVGLFSAAFGLGARPMISDVLTGVGLIFEDAFAVGEKVEILTVEGVVEAVNLRTTWIRSPTGELYTVPNGEIRVVRNFSRGRFSTVSVRLRLAAADLRRALPLLESLGVEAVAFLPNLLEPWQVLSESGEIASCSDLTLLAKARLGKAAEMRPRLLALVQEHLAEAGITLEN